MSTFFPRFCAIFFYNCICNHMFLKMYALIYGVQLTRTVVPLMGIRNSKGKGLRWIKMKIKKIILRFLKTFFSFFVFSLNNKFRNSDGHINVVHRAYRRYVQSDDGDRLNEGGHQVRGMADRRRPYSDPPQSCFVPSRQ